MGTSSSKPQDDVEEVTKRVESLSIGGIKDDGGGRERKRGYVYVLEERRVGDEGPHFYKFGQSGNPADRRKNLQTGNPRELKMFAVSAELDDCVAGEEHLMNEFEQYKCPPDMNGGTEWFMVGDDQNEAFRQSVSRAVQQLQ